MSEIVIGTTVAPFKGVDGEATQWLEVAELMVKDAVAAGFSKVYFMAAAELDSRGDEPYASMLERLGALSSVENAETAVWRFAIDDGESVINPINRLIRICTGRNLVGEYALRHKEVTHVLYLDSDLRVPEDSISKLMEVDADIVGGDVPSYCLGGPVDYSYSFPVQQHWNTAGYLLVRRSVVRHIKWRSDVHDTGNSDDPCFAADAVVAGFSPTLVRKDIIGRHKPLQHLEHRGHDLRIRK